jgi:hypothetical protein
LTHDADGKSWLRASLALTGLYPFFQLTMLNLIGRSVLGLCTKPVARNPFNYLSARSLITVKEIKASFNFLELVAMMLNLDNSILHMPLQRAQVGMAKLNRTDWSSTLHCLQS